MKSLNFLVYMIIGLANGFDQEGLSTSTVFVTERPPIVGGTVTELPLPATQTSPGAVPVPLPPKGQQDLGCGYTYCGEILLAAGMEHPLKTSSCTHMA